MAAKNSKGVTVCIADMAVAGGVTQAATAATLAKPSMITVADVTGLAEGMLIKLANDSTGIPELDGKTFVIQNVQTAANTFELAGSDATGSAGTFAGGTDMQAYAETAMTCLCLSSMTFNPNQAEVLSVGTYCDPSASISSAATSAGTVDIGGYVNITDLDYIALLAWEEDGNERMVRITMPENGWIVFPATLGPVSIDVPLDGAIAWSAQATLGSKPKHMF